MPHFINKLLRLKKQSSWSLSTFVAETPCLGHWYSIAFVVFPPEIKKGMVNFLRKGHFSAWIFGKGHCQNIRFISVVTVLLWYNLLEMNTAYKGKNLVINYNTYFISLNIIFISKSSSEWMSELRFNVPPTTRSCGDGTSLIIIIIFFICLKLFLLLLSLS